MGVRHGDIWRSDPLCVWIHLSEHVFCRYFRENVTGQDVRFEKMGEIGSAWTIKNHCHSSYGIAEEWQWFFDFLRSSYWILGHFWFQGPTGGLVIDHWRNPWTEPEQIVRSHVSRGVWLILSRIRWGRMEHRQNTVNVEFYMGHPLRHTKVTCCPVTFMHKSKFSKTFKKKVLEIISCLLQTWRTLTTNWLPTTISWCRPSHGSHGIFRSQNSHFVKS